MKNFGDGIMSTINFSMEIKRQQDPEGDRVDVVLSSESFLYKAY